MKEGDFFTSHTGTGLWLVIRGHDGNLRDVCLYKEDGTELIQDVSRHMVGNRNTISIKIIMPIILEALQNEFTKSS